MSDPQSPADGDDDQARADHPENGDKHAETDDHGHEGHQGNRDHDHGSKDHHHESKDHHHAHDMETVGVAILTVSSSRTLEEDPSGDYLVQAFEDAGHEIVIRELVPDDFDGIQATVNRLSNREDTDVVVTTGGTGITPDDVTPEAVVSQFDKQLPGFGELFRRLSYAEVGTSTIGSRAIGGVNGGTPVFCLPGSENAARVAAEEILLPEIGHLAGLAAREE